MNVTGFTYEQSCVKCSLLFAQRNFLFFRPKGSEESLISTDESIFEKCFLSLWDNSRANVGPGSDVHVIDPWTKCIEKFGSFFNFVHHQLCPLLGSQC